MYTTDRVVCTTDRLEVLIRFKSRQTFDERDQRYSNMHACNLVTDSLRIQLIPLVSGEQALPKE